MKIFVVTSPRLGRDCVLGSYIAESEEALDMYLWSSCGYDEKPKNWDKNHVIHNCELRTIRSIGSHLHLNEKITSMPRDPRNIPDFPKENV